MTDPTPNTEDESTEVIDITVPSVPYKLLGEIADSTGISV